MIQPNSILQKRLRNIDIFGAILTVAFASFFSADLLAAEHTSTKQADTTEYQTPEVQVTADRIQTSPITKFSSSYYLDNKQVQSIGAMQANELLSKSPGIYIKNYGGAGGLKSLSIRGTNSSQNLIMIDGIALNSSQNAMYDISLLPTSFINSMEVVRGGASDTYGANALGGVVNFITEANPKSNQFSANFSTASYDEYKLSADYAFKSNSFYSIIGGEYYNSKGNYEFEFNQNGETVTLNRDNAAFENIALNLSIGSDVFDNWKLSFKSIMSKTNRGVPGAVVQNRVESLFATIDEANVMNIISLSNIFAENHSLKFTLLGKFSQQHYIDDAPNSFDKLNNTMFINREVRAIAKYNYSVENFNYQLNSEYNFAELRGDMLDFAIGDYVKRTNFSLNSLADKAVELDSANRISFSPSARLDVFSDNSPFVSYGLGLLYSNSDLLTEVKLRASQNFRMPSFNELYYYNYGTANLKPEESASYSISISKSLFDMMKIEIGGFYINTDNQIISVPKNTISWSAKNIGKVITQGMELMISGSLFTEDISYNLAYTRQTVKDKSTKAMSYDKLIVYSPQEILNISLNYRIAQFDIMTNCEYTSHRFSMTDNSYGSMLSNYLLFNAGISYSTELYEIKTKFRIDCQNITDKQYQVIMNYPMPGRIFRASISIGN